MPTFPIVESGYNPYKYNVQGKANEPICVAGLLDRARRILGLEVHADLGDVYDRLDANAPRIAIIGGSPDHPAHVMDLETVLMAAAHIWEKGGVPFSFAIPVVCDGTAQSTRGMSYSLQSRNAVAEMVVNQMEGQGYHGAFVIQGCDKTPMAIVSALALLDRLRQARGEASVFATFAPAHVLKGGTIPADLRAELEDFARSAEQKGYSDIADDVRDALAYILQCSSNTSFQGVFVRAVEAGLLTPAAHKHFEKRLAVNTCDAKGGICAFHGTGNSSRDVVSAFGLVHPALELLTDPPTPGQVNAAIDALFTWFDNPAYSVGSLVKANIENAIRVHSALGGSTNLIMHIVAAMNYAGVSFSIDEYSAIRTAAPIPDIFNYSLTEGRDVFAWAQQCCAGQSRGIETVIYELNRLGVPMILDAPTVTGQTWRQRLSDPRSLSADSVKENPIILARPQRKVSGIDVLRGNWFESAVVKISGLPETHLDEFDEKVAVVVYFESEDDAIHQLLDPNFVSSLESRLALSPALLAALHRHNSIHPSPRPPRSASPRGPWSPLRGEGAAPLPLAGGGAGGEGRFQEMVNAKTLKLAFVISGQGPEAWGMPEMATSMLHVMASKALKPLVSVISDGRYSGVTYGAAIGHVTPEAIRGGGILYLQDGDLIHLRLRKLRLDLLERLAFEAHGRVTPFEGALAADRRALGEERRQRLIARRRGIAPTNLLVGCTDASRGVVPVPVAEAAVESVNTLSVTR
jgi:dihydroxyacid dehydratase/phosphogluconate dehydratase